MSEETSVNLNERKKNDDDSDYCVWVCFLFFFCEWSNLLGGRFVLPERLRFRVVCCAWLSLDSGGVVVCVYLSSSDEG